jgi:cyclic 2,3-diphosphoglycerate synthetase
VLGPAERLRLASRALALGLPYVGADFRFDPPTLEPFDLPSIGIVGTGKRVGKTALAGHAARLLSERYDVVVVAMGRGGPPTPEVAESPPGIDELLELSRAGRHAASDYLEDAALAGVVTIGCRRAGGGLAGMPFASNVDAGAAIAAERSPDLVLFEGSGATFPPVETRKARPVVGGRQRPEIATGYLNAYRILVSDLVVVVGGDEPVDAIRELTGRARAAGRAAPSPCRACPTAPQRSSRPRRPTAPTSCAERSKTRASTSSGSRRTSPDATSCAPSSRRPTRRPTSSS